MLSRDFYLRDSNEVAQDLLGKLLVHKTQSGILSGMIVEVEAYRGPDDAASHSYGNLRSARTEIQYGPGGFAYIYFIYGMYSCFNVVTNVKDKPEAVLIRGLEPVEGIPKMMENRNSEKFDHLCSGPGKLCAALEINRELYGADLCGDRLYLEDYRDFSPEEIGVSPRINVEYAGEWKDRLWRYFVKDHSCVSRVAKQYRTNLTLADIQT